MQQEKKMKYKKYLICVFAFIAICIVCIKQMHSRQEETYTKITSVDGVTFDMPEKLLEQATAIAFISDHKDYSTDTYLFKDGKSIYLLLDKGNIVVAVENMTNYRLKDTANMEDAIAGESLDGIWMNPIGEELSCEIEEKDSVYKLVADVRGKVPLSTEAYGLFVGKFAYVSVDDYECSIFVGAKANDYDSLEKNELSMTEHIAKSLNATDLTGNLIMTDDARIEKESDKTNRGFVIKSNQGTTGTKYSDIYHLLKIGETGLYHAYDKNAENGLSEGEITIDQLYTGDDAVKLVKEYCQSGKSMYQYADAPAGYSWQVIRYHLSKSQNELYTNIRIEGLDGERLKYHGISCTTRTYDMIYDWDSTTDLYCYYAVPDGCEEYMLECGNRYQSTSETACFWIECD